MNRREFLRSAAAVLGGLLLGKRATAEETDIIVDGSNDVVTEPLDDWLICEEPGSTEWPLPGCESSFMVTSEHVVIEDFPGYVWTSQIESRPEFPYARYCYAWVDGELAGPLTIEDHGYSGGTYILEEDKVPEGRRRATLKLVSVLEGTYIFDLLFLQVPEGMDFQNFCVTRSLHDPQLVGGSLVIDGDMELVLAASQGTDWVIGSYERTPCGSIQKRGVG